MTNEDLLQEIANARAERDTAIAYARIESKKAQSAEYWRDVAGTQLGKAKEARNRIYDLLKARGYVTRSYGELQTPKPEFRTVVDGDKRATHEQEILQIVTHLLETPLEAGQ